MSEFVLAIDQVDEDGNARTNTPAFDAHVVHASDAIVIDLAQPETAWKDGPRLYIERRSDCWRVYVHPDDDDPTHIVYICDDGGVGVEEV